jgi:hypothetical protein
LTDDWNYAGLWNRIALASRRPTSGFGVRGGREIPTA